ncbi:MAG TPA: ATP-grasp domain-containing protein [Kineosporiaceae bacterium]|nr:ATP-grasp domain-containing protein [Kineosporiaceae bacterium]
MRLVVIGANPAVAREADALPAEVIHVQLPGAVGLEDLGGRVLTVDYRESLAFLAFVDRMLAPLAPTAVVSLTECGLEPAAAANERLGTRGTELSVVRAMRNKLTMRRLLAEHAPHLNPGFAPGDDPAAIERLFARHAAVVVKPVDGSGSSDLALIRALADLPAERRTAGTLLEQFIGGTEFSVEALSSNGCHRVIGIAQKRTTTGFVEVSHVMPAPSLDGRRRKLVERAVVELLDVLGLKDGPSHSEVKVDGDRVTVIETHNRLGGDGIADLVKLTSGINWRRLALGWAIGVPIEPEPATAPAAATVFCTAAPGRVTAVAERPILTNAAIADWDIAVQVGDLVQPLRSSHDRLGCATLTAASPLDCASAVAELTARRIVTTQPDGNHQTGNHQCQQGNQMSVNNVPIAYDFHGDAPFSLPFREIKPEEIHIYLDLDTRVGKSTCGQKCTHCWFVNYEKVYNKSFELAEGPLIKESLEAQGYHIYPRFVDSFAYDGQFMRIYGPANNREFRQESDHKPTETMEKGDAWTSGRPLLADNYLELLDLARDSGYGTISITYHGVIDDNLAVVTDGSYPIKGVFSGADTEEVLRRIAEYNRQQPGAKVFRTNIGVTIGRHNHGRRSLYRYARYFNQLGVDTVRFNNFADHGGRHPDLVLSIGEIKQAYRDLKWLHDSVDLSFQLAVSEDFGTFGIKEMGFPAHVGWCRAGRQLFAAIPTTEVILEESDGQRREKIGDIVGCVNTFEPHLGYLVRTVAGPEHDVSYSLEFDHSEIDAFTAKRMAGTYQDGCFARELSAEKGLVSRIPARHRLPIVQAG